MDARGGNGADESCAVSLDGVPLRPDGNGEACWASSGTTSNADGTRLKTLNAESGKTMARLAAEIVHEVWPDDGRCRRRHVRQLDVSGETPANRQATSLMHISARSPTVATD